MTGAHSNLQREVPNHYPYGCPATAVLSLYPKAQCRLLVRAVRHLSDKLRRPVSSRDLEAHFRQHPDERPQLFQAIGQQLIKSARPVSKDRVYRIGLLGNQAYYAADKDPYWKDMLAMHEADLVLHKAIKENLPNQIRGLIGGPQNALARNALAGWAAEMAQYLKHASGTDSAAIMQDVLFFGTFKDFPWAGVRSIDLIGKDEAIMLLTQELTERAPFKLEAGINWYRLLCPWRWPQSSLFQRPAGAPVYSRRQLTLLAQSLWPDRGEDGELARAELVALRYGLPAQ